MAERFTPNWPPVTVSIRAPAGGAIKLPDPKQLGAKVSIRAPAGGAIMSCRSALRSMVLFQSAPLREGR